MIPADAVFTGVMDSRDAVTVAGLPLAAPALAQTSLTGSSITLKSNTSTTLSSNGYLGTYLVVPAGGATVNFTVNATVSAGAGRRKASSTPSGSSSRVWAPRPLRFRRITWRWSRTLTRS